MTFNDVLVDLFTHLRAENQPILIGWNTVQAWPEGALESFLQTGFISSAPAAQSIECTACDKRCFMEVINLTHNKLALPRAFIVCDDADMQNQIGRIQIPLERLQQWQSSVKHIATVIAELLNFKDKINVSPNQSVIKLGMMKSEKGRRWVTFNYSDLSLEINQSTVPLEEVLYFDDRQLFIDRDYIDDLLNRVPARLNKVYSPSKTRREAKKLETQAMYQDWNDEYLKLKKLHPNKSKTWCSLQIAKMDIAKGKDAETIRRNLKT